MHVLALFCFCILARTGSRSSSIFYDGVIILAVIAAKNMHSIHAAFTEFVLHLGLAGGMEKTIVAAAIGITLPMILMLCPSRGLQRITSNSTDWREASRNAQPQPQILPCRIMHTRLFPKRHCFSYSYLYVGIPIGWTGTINTLLSADIAGTALQSGNSESCRTWFSVEGSDHLQRTSSEHTLLQKLHSYLDSQGIASQQYPYAYLVTAPRFLGFSFNPVSFWYLYSEKKQLTAMILEVNNTFDERRMYFLDGKNQHGDQAHAKEDMFTNTWEKDFHVSPFNERGGIYSLKANDPFAPELSGRSHIDNTITLRSTDGKHKIVARVFSAEQPILVSRLNRLQIFRFISRWWWVGFMTNVRILCEARKLWVKKLPVFYRPEVMKTSVGRQASNEENILAEHFLTFLRYLQNCSPEGFPIQYTAAAGKCRGLSITIPASVTAQSGALQSGSIVDLHILTPAFYSRFVQYPDVAEAFQELCECDIETQRMAVLSDPEKFQQQIKAATCAKQPLLSPEVLQACSTLQAARRCKILRATLLLFLDMVRIPGGLQSLKSASSSLVDLAIFGSSVHLSEESRQYSHTVMAVLLARRLAFGSTGLLRFYSNVLRFVLLCLVAGEVNTTVLTLQAAYPTSPQL
jgi:DUF1365 family protein